MSLLPGDWKVQVILKVRVLEAVEAVLMMIKMIIVFLLVKSAI